ncbi:CPBP family intramembrane glutamic endopeptidase [Lentzea tibetensis]|uniref:CPBP family intramembrane glutamic endopeptidase n=1 Tax=Lentzea tibetensis TaxID=2591470 RepID=UPI001644EE61|nr:CPBP family intramembrane glutamic endopeptidase [Lentzea tibetensis]
MAFLPGFVALFALLSTVPNWFGALVGTLVGALIQLVYPLTGKLTGATPTLLPGWGWVLLGIFAFHGVAEELVWRGYAYRRLREGRTFWRAVLLTMPLIAATHIPIVIGSGPAVGAAAMVVAAVTSIPLAHLFEMGRDTIWAPAVLHTAIDTFKLFTLPDAVFPLLLAGVSVVVPLLVLLAGRPGRSARPAAA